MNEKRFTHRKWYNERQLFDGEEPFAIVDIYIQSDKICDKLNEIAEENEQLKQCLNEAKNDEKQLSIDFMGFKMKLIEQLQIRYDYASEQRQKNLDNLLIAKAYDIIRYDVRKLAEEMGVDFE